MHLVFSQAISLALLIVSPLGFQEPQDVPWPPSVDPTTRMQEYDRAVQEEALWTQISNDYSTRGFYVGNVGMFLIMDMEKKMKALNRQEARSTDFEFFREGKQTPAMLVAKIASDNGPRQQAMSALLESPGIDKPDSAPRAAYQRLAHEQRVSFVRAAGLARMSIDQGDGIWTRYDYFWAMEMAMSMGGFDEPSPLMRWERIECGKEGPGVGQYLAPLVPKIVERLPGPNGSLEIGARVSIELIDGQRAEGVLAGGDERKILISGRTLSRESIKSVRWLEETESIEQLKFVLELERKATAAFEQRLKELLAQEALAEKVAEEHLKDSTKGK